ncbi:molybdenum cofactor biosysynthesis protein [Streptomyces chrestomyceticus JCM 4735]|uniref:Molybdenum cofactor biosysynthesis protein n=2 Tax=Streptomyces chrestomyceticus TaxID=68185 RepID=A0A7U9KVN9_9ACTN|nr:molybdenum cofactor biosysynthesis protein [Streptomyces chrestomyceticus JCM 4735]
MVGTVTTLWRYPVKSLLGEEVPDISADARGLAGDRALALVHQTSGQVASAKNPRLWRDLLKLRAEIIDGAVRITLPSGRTVRSTDPHVHRTLTAHLGQPVTLADAPPEKATLERSRPEEVLAAGAAAEVPHETLEIASQAPPGTFFDFAPLHLITRATLDRITELGPRATTVEAERYRPNVVIRTEAAGFVENDWPGRDLRIGDELTLRVVARTPRCAVPTLEHGRLPRDPDALRVPARHNRVVPMEEMGPQPCAGVYAQVVRPGRIRQGDAVRLV